MILALLLLGVILVPYAVLRLVAHWTRDHKREGWNWTDEKD